LADDHRLATSWALRGKSAACQGSGPELGPNLRRIPEQAEEVASTDQLDRLVCGFFLSGSRESAGGDQDPARGGACRHHTVELPNEANVNLACAPLLALDIGGLSSPLEDKVNSTVGAVGGNPDFVSLATVGLRHPSLKVSPAEGTDRVQILVETEEFVPPAPVELARQSKQCDKTCSGGCY
jgi:hypothetical protein